MLSILVLEDLKSTQDAWRRVLAGYGDVRIVACPAEARVVLNTGFRPDIIFSDWDMPGETGGSFCQWLRDQGDTTPLVIVSGLDRSSAMPELPANAYMLKPFAREDVADMIATLVPRTTRVSKRVAR